MQMQLLQRGAAVSIKISMGLDWEACGADVGSAGIVRVAAAHSFQWGVQLCSGTLHSN
jgi:hypothetical protein